MAIAGSIISGILRRCYIILNLAGLILIRLLTNVPKEKDPLPRIGNREILTDSVTTLAEKV